MTKPRVKTKWFRASMPHISTLFLGVEDRRVVHAEPVIVKWMVGKPWATCLAWLDTKGVLEVTRINNPDEGFVRTWVEETHSHAW